MVAILTDEEKLAELSRRRAPFTRLVQEVTQGDPGMKERTKEGGFFWVQAVLHLISSEARRFAECMATLGEQQRMELFLLCSQITTALPGGGVRAMWVAANMIQPGVCDMRPSGTLAWNRKLSIGGNSVSEIDFFLAYDLLDKEDGRG